MSGHETTAAHTNAAAEMLALAAHACSTAPADDSRDIAANAVLLRAETDSVAAYIGAGDLPNALRATLSLGAQAILAVADISEQMVADMYARSAATRSAVAQQ